MGKLSPSLPAQPVHLEPDSLSPNSRRRAPPPLPPRREIEIRTEVPPPYSLEDQNTGPYISEQWCSDDPRSSSTQSLVPVGSRGGRRTLMLVYIHGFMGNETSFQSFPAHLHNLLTLTLVGSHAVHTKIYPRYKSRRAIEFARDDFSNWLEPHESPSTDIVLLGHSMGGLLAAESALMAPRDPSSRQEFRHRVLGTVNFDTPFLGMHPGIVVSGIGSLFRAAPLPPGSPQAQQSDPSPSSHSGMTSHESLASSPGSSSSPASSSPNTTYTQLSQATSSTSSLHTITSNDPYFDPPFPNDVRLRERKGWSSLLHFVNKHSDGLTSATKQYFMSHIEFGGCLADFPGLKRRYQHLRALEDVDALHGYDGTSQPPNHRIRFVNYYTASTGIPKKPKSPQKQPQDEERQGRLRSIEREISEVNLDDARSRSLTPGPRISLEEYGDSGVVMKEVEEAEEASPVKAQMEHIGEASGVQDNEGSEPPQMRHIDSMPIDDEEFEEHNEEEFHDAEETVTVDDDHYEERDIAQIAKISTDASLPPIPPVPEEPGLFDTSIYTDKDERKIAEKEHKRIQRVHQQAVKDRDSALKDRRKLLEKREKKARQERERALKAEEKQRLKEEKEEQRRQATEEKATEAATAATILQSTLMEGQALDTEVTKAEKQKSQKKKRDRKFCLMPWDLGGEKDECWVRVYMEGVDEVGAHCGLFFPGPQYESLVGDVGSRVEQWVMEDATRRVILEMA